MRVKVLKTLTVIAWIGLAISCMSMDSENIIPPLVIGGISLAWLFLIMVANSEDLDKKEKPHRNASFSKTNSIISDYSDNCNLKSKEGA